MPKTKVEILFGWSCDRGVLENTHAGRRFRGMGSGGAVPWTPCGCQLPYVAYLSPAHPSALVAALGSRIHEPSLNLTSSSQSEHTERSPIGALPPVSGELVGEG